MSVFMFLFGGVVGFVVGTLAGYIAGLQAEVTSSRIDGDRR